MKVASSDIQVKKVLNKDGDNVYSSPISKFYTNKVFTWKAGCEYKTDAEREEAKRLNGFNIVVIDSCEYLINTETGGYAGYGYFAHKGNCRFCNERNIYS